MKRLFQNIGWLLGGRGFNAVMSLLYLYLATNALGIENFGYFAIIVALGQTVTGLANFQTWQFIVRWGANGDGPAEATGFAIALDLLSVVMGAVIAAFIVWTAQLWLPLPDELLWLTFGYCIVSLLSIRTTPTGLLRLRFKFATATGAEAVQPAIRAAGAVLAALFMPVSLSLGVLPKSRWLSRCGTPPRATSGSTFHGSASPTSQPNTPMLGGSCGQPTCRAVSQSQASR